MIELKNVSYDYVTKAGVVHALREVNALFEGGTLHAVVGRSGSGKTTLISMIAGLDVPKEGSVLALDKDLGKADRDKFRSKNVGMIFQSYYLLPQFTAKENILLPVEFFGNKETKKSRDAIAEKLLEEVGLTSFHGKKRPNQLSGGEQQRVAIARALATDPSIILADEPTGNLDNENSENIVRLLKSLAKKGKCVIVVTHSLEVAAEADAVWEMSDGRLKRVR